MVTINHNFEYMFYFSGTRKPNFTQIQKIDYNSYWKERGFALRSKLMERERIFFQWVGEKSSVIDVGCGNSRLLVELARQKECLCSGFDLSPFVVEGLRQEGIRAETVDIESPDFSLSGNYDYLIASEVLEHLREPEVFVDIIRSHARYFIFSIPNSAFYRYRWGLLIKGRFFTQWRHHPSEHLRYWSHIDFLDWLTALGFEVVESKASNGFWFKNLFPNLFGHQVCYLCRQKMIY